MLVDDVKHQSKTGCVKDLEADLGNLLQWTEKMNIHVVFPRVLVTRDIGVLMDECFALSPQVKAYFSI